MRHIRYDIISRKNGATCCNSCGAHCQGFKDPAGRILCYDCFKKIWGKEP